MNAYNFVYGEKQYEMKRNKNELDFISDYLSIINKRNNELYILYKGKVLNLNDIKTLKILCTKKNIQNIFIFNIKINHKVNLKEIKNIICPECNNLSTFFLNEDKISLKNCINNHDVHDLTFNKFINAQTNNEAISCSICKNNQHFYNDKIYICSCNKFICPLCAKTHDKTHSMILYNDIAYKCRHNNEFCSYCFDCNKNLCEICEKEHNEKHKFMLYKSIFPNTNKLNKIKEEIDDNKKKIKQYKMEIEKLSNYYQNNITNIINDLDGYLFLSDYFTNSINKIKNYETIKNLINFTNFKLKGIDEFLNDNFKNKYKRILDLIDSKKNELLMIYKNDGEIKLFGKKFVKTNKDKGFLLINNSISELSLFMDDKKIKDRQIKVSLIEEKTITSMSFMFHYCPNLISITENSKWDAENIKYLDCMFHHCPSLTIIPDINKWNLSSLISMTNMIFDCKKLVNVPGVGKLKNSNINKIKENVVFDSIKNDRLKFDINTFPIYESEIENYKKLAYFINFSKFNNKIKKTNEMTLVYDNIIGVKKVQLFGHSFVSYENIRNCIMKINNDIFPLDEFYENKNDVDRLTVTLIEIGFIENMSWMFSKCKLLSPLSDFSKWDTYHVTNMRGMFEYCESLKSIPDISKLNTTNVTDMSYMFLNCKSLESMPDISKWNTSNVTDMRSMFSGCKSLKSIPNISNWNTSNVTNMREMFYSCDSLLSVPDISKWNTSNLSTIQHIFSESNSLKSLPDISNWDITKINDLSETFLRCESLISLPDISKWNTINVTNMEDLFKECKSLISLPDISKWNIKNVINISNIFAHCQSLETLPDISKWDISNVTNISSIFYDCNSLLYLPDISKWNINKVNSLSNLFSFCKSLKSLPDISKWNTSNITNMYSMFYSCESLKSLPDISKWNTSNVSNMEHMFYYCESLLYLPDISKWNTSNVQNMREMFYCCKSLKKMPDISKWNILNIKEMEGIFYGCKSLPYMPEINKNNFSNEIHKVYQKIIN